MRKSIIGLALTAALSVSLPQVAVADTAPTIKTVEELLSMAPADRKAYIRGLEQEQRRGLWAKVRRAQLQSKGISPKLRGTGMTPHTITVDKRSFFTSGSTSAKAGKSIGTIAYDSDFPSISFGGGAIVGNRFDTHTGLPVISSGTVSTVQAVVVQGPAFTQTSSNAGIVILGPQTVGGGATALFSTFTTANGVIDTVSFAGLGVNYTGDEFFVLVADNANQYVPVLGAGTNLGQGHHGLVGYTGGLGITGTFNLGGNVNTFVRATGNIVPVELMSFGVE